MAEFWSNNDRGYRLRLVVDQVSQSISNNTSQVRVRLALLNTTTTFASYSCSGWAEINGRRLTWSGSPSVLSHNMTLSLIDQTITVSHNADGRKSFGVSASFSGSGGYSPRTLTISGNTFTLSTIPRSSSVSVPNGTIGSPVLITINRQSSSFTHTLRYSWSGKSGIIAQNVGGSYNWTIPLDFANDIPTGLSGRGVIYVDTYSGSTKAGTQQTNFTASVADTSKPTVTGLTLTDLNTATAGLLAGQNYLQVISNIRVTFNGVSASSGATITGYYAEIVSKNIHTNENNGRLGMMNFSGQAVVRGYVTDSRGKQSNPVEVAINVLPYHAPVLSFTAYRTTESPSTIQVLRSAKIAPLTIAGSQKNTMTLSFKVSPIGGSYATDNGSASGTWTTVSNLVDSPANLSGTYQSDKTFYIKGTLSDRFTSTDFVVTVSPETVVQGYDKDGRLGVGKPPELGGPGSIDAAGPIFSGGKYIQHHRLTFNDGVPFKLEGDLNNALTTGFFYGINLANQPTGGHNWKYYHIVRYNSKYVLQQAVDFEGGVCWFRTCFDNTWSEWKQIVTSEHENLVRTSWISTGVDGVHYKRVGDTVYLRMWITATANQALSLGSIPAELVPISGTGTMFRVPGWAVDQSIGRNLQINEGGTISLLTSNRSDTFRTQISWAI
ncbi:TPA: DUF859 domain-containing protein [Streptococcus suis]|nr:DUF859 domain-containing protein [Streptococcus suis]